MHITRRAVVILSLVRLTCSGVLIIKGAESISEIIYRVYIHR